VAPIHRHLDKLVADHCFLLAPQLLQVRYLLQRWEHRPLRHPSDQ